MKQESLLKYKIIILISLSILLSSCVSIKKLQKLNPEKNDIFSLNKFNGFYENNNLSAFETLT